MANFENKSIGVFIDGGYFAKVNEALERQMKMSKQEIKEERQHQGPLPLHSGTDRTTG